MIHLITKALYSISDNYWIQAISIRLS